MKPAQFLICNDKGRLYNEVIKVITAKVESGRVFIKYLRERDQQILTTYLPIDFKLKEI